MASATSLEAVQTLLREHMPELRDRFRVASLGLFGSYVRRDHNQGSDVDILVEFAPDAGPGFFELLLLQERIGEIVGRPVDLVTRGTLKPRIG